MIRLPCFTALGIRRGACDVFTPGPEPGAVERLKCQLRAIAAQICAQEDGLAARVHEGTQPTKIVRSAVV
eukprot:6488629-Amphidinium_carterae.2